LGDVENSYQADSKDGKLEKEYSPLSSSHSGNEQIPRRPENDFAVFAEKGGGVKIIASELPVNFPIDARIYVPFPQAQKKINDMERDNADDCDRLCNAL
jgi:hypothetical protein